MSHFSVARGVGSIAAVCLLFAGAARAQTPAQTPQPGQDAQSQAQLREELQRLRAEFESIRDAYGARLSALEARLAQQPGEPAAAPAVAPVPVLPPVTQPETPPAVAAQPAQVPPPEAAVPAGAGGRRRASRGLAGLRQCQRDVEDLQPGHRRHRQLHRRGGQERGRAPARAAAGRGRGQLPGGRRPLRARAISSSRPRRKGWRLRKAS